MKQLLLSIVCIPVFSSFLLLPLFQRQTDIYQGFNFRTDKQVAVGYITSLQIGATTYKGDIVVKDPLNPAVSLGPVVGVMSNFSWTTGLKDPMYLSMQISTANKMQAASAALLNGALSGPVKLSVVIYEYDPLAKKYFKSFYNSAANLSGTFLKSGEDFSFAVADDASTEVASPVNYALQMAIMPQAGISQPLTIATSSKTAIAKSWGQ